MHAVPIGTRLLLNLPFTDGLLAGGVYEPFCPGITGIVECWVIGHTPIGPDAHGYVAEPSYTISPYKNHRIGGQLMWDFIAEIDSQKGAPKEMNPVLWGQCVTIELLEHRVERRIPERIILPFVQKD